MTTDSSAANPASASWLEDLVAEALEVLDREGEEGFEAFLAKHPARRAQVLELVAPFRQTGLLARDARDQIPERLGEFRLLERLGSGGMGVVFLAEQESLARKVALKIIRPDLVFFAGTRERFRREIEVIARLSHPAIVPIVATGEHDGMPWYAMQRILGCTVDEAVKRLKKRDPATLVGHDLEHVVRTGGEAPSQLDRSIFADGYWQACVRLVRQAALGLEHAHRQGIVHRDVKPSNVMLTADGRAMLLDFGLARVHGDDKLTRTGGEPGSPAYMAPEQIRGHTADERADVYSLATTLFQLLDLEPPFASTDPETLRQQILRGKLGGLKNRAVPHELRVVLAAAMDVDRERRYATAAALAADLDAVLVRRPIAARTLPLRVRTLRWLQRHRTASAALGAFALLAVVLPAALLWQQRSSFEELRIEKQKVETSRDALRVEKQKAETSRDSALTAIGEFLTRFASSELATMPSGNRIGFELLERALANLEAMKDDVAPKVLREHRTHARRWYVSALRVRGQVDQAVAVGLATLADWHGEQATSPSMALLLAGVRLDLLAMALRGAKVPNLDDVVAPLDAELAQAMATPGLALPVARLRVDEAIDRAEHDMERGNKAAAEERLRAAIAKWSEDPIGKSMPGDLSVLRNRYGEMLRDRGEFDAAREQFEAVRRLLGDGESGPVRDPEVMHVRGYALWELGRIAYQHEEWEESLPFLVAAAEQYERHVVAFPDDPRQRISLACVLTELAQVERQRGVDEVAVVARLERARRFFFSDVDQITRDRRSREAACTDLQLLLESYWRAHDVQAMAKAARDFAAITPQDAQRQSMAAWRLLQAAVWFDERDDEDAAKACDDDAMKALLACDAAGWFPPVNLDQGPTMRLRGRPEFDALRAKHPPEKATRQRSK